MGSRSFLIALGGCAWLASVGAGVATAQEAVRVTERGVLLDFQEADLRLVIAALADAGSLNVVYSELPARRVTLRTPQPVAIEDIRGLIRSLALANGLTLIEEASFLRLEVNGSASETSGQAKGAAGNQEESRLFVYRLKHARAVRLAGTLQSLFGAPRTEEDRRAPTRQSLSETLRDQRIQPVDSAREQPAVTTPTPGLQAELRGDIQIVPDEATNSLLVRAQPSDWTVIEQAIQALDLRPLQVLIEVVIAEVRRTREMDVGISAQGTEQRDGGLKEGQLKGSTAGDFTVRLTSTGSVDIELALSALSATGDVKILSRPVILAQNNQEARILVGAERPFVQVFRSLPTDGAVRDQVVQYRDVGTSLTILPTINSDGYVNLQITQEVSTATSETQFGAPIISTREAMTHLLARNGQTVVIGGLIDRQRDRSRSGIPLLQDVPVIGGLFGTTRTFEGTSELFLFVTPHLVATDEDADRLRESVSRQLPLLERLGPVQSIIRRDSVPQDTIRRPPRRD